MQRNDGVWGRESDSLYPIKRRISDFKIYYPLYAAVFAFALLSTLASFIIAGKIYLYAFGIVIIIIIGLLSFVRPDFGLLAMVLTAPLDDFLTLDLAFKLKIYEFFALPAFLGICFAILFKANNIEWRKVPLLRPLLAYWIFAVFPLSLGVAVADSIIIMAIELIMIAIYVLIVQITRSQKHIIAIYNLILASSFLPFMVAVFQVGRYIFYGMSDKLFDLHLYAWGRPAGTFVEPVYLGVFALAILVMALPLLLTASSFWYRVFLLLVIAANTVTLALTMSRAAWAGLLIGLLIVIVMLLKQYGFRNRKLYKFIKSFGGVSLVLLLLIMIFLPGLYESVTQRTAEVFNLDWDVQFQSSASSRLWNLSESLRLIADSPIIGHGPGTGGILMEKSIWTAFEDPYFYRGGSKSLILMPMVERGILGFILFLLFFVGWPVLMFKAWRRTNDENVKVLIAGAVAAYIAVMFVYQFSNNYLLAFFWVLLGWGAAVTAYVGEHQRPAEETEERHSVDG